MNSYNLKNSIIVVTGAAGQLGQSIVNQALDCGACIAAMDISKENLQTVASKHAWTENVFLQEVDITKEDSIKNAYEGTIKKFGRIDSVINNAGISVFDPWYDRAESDFDMVMNVNLKGTFLCIKQFLKYLIKSQNNGSIVNIASHYGIISPDPRIYTDCDRRNSEVYGATKAGIIQMTKYFSVNALEDGASVRINSVAPGGILNEANPQGPEFQKLYSERCPMKRMASVDEMTGPILFLLSSDASYINGHTIVVDGGMSSW
tara:strand:- start:434 stop:1219 length:786 start_codon:yes stop_codon:yes gene_type:complete